MYWNADPMNLPKDFYRFYLENICFANKLANPNHLILNKIQINLKKIKLPIFCVAGSKDHIAAWQSVYKGARLYGGNIKFILADAGHVKGLINPQFKINYFKNNKLTIDPKTWLKNAKKYSGSWWGSWINWLNKINNQKVSANRMLQILDQYKLGEAPGKYIL